MNEEFIALIDKLPSLMSQVSTAPLRPWNKLGELPARGIYVFYEDNVPIYVGRTNRMKKRVKEHGQKSSGPNRAPFAFNIAKKEAKALGVKVDVPRETLKQNTEFDKLFRGAKTRVSEMSVRVVEVYNPIVQTIFEVYASMELKTDEYNNFENH